MMDSFRVIPKRSFQTTSTKLSILLINILLRTITLGEDLTVNNELDNQYKCQIYAALGGAYYSKKDVAVTVAVDNSILGSGMRFGSGKDEILPMPSSYFKLASDKIIIPSGTIAGSVDVQLTDAFFC